MAKRKYYFEVVESFVEDKTKEGIVRQQLAGGVAHDMLYRIYLRENGFKEEGEESPEAGLAEKCLSEVS